jgi:biotin carboxyl carrier protein
MKFSYQVNGQIRSLELDASRDGYRANLEGTDYGVRVIFTATNEISFSLGNQSFRAYTATDSTQRWVFLNGQTFVLTQPATNRRQIGLPRESSRSTGEREIIAPMPGQIRAVNAIQGEEVEKGQTLLLLEAMKMEIRIQAPRSGTLVKLAVETGQTVEREQLLAEID